jgi:hypothetical protein
MSKKSRQNREEQLAQQAAADAPMPKIYVSTPSLDGNMSWGYVKTVLDIQRTCIKWGMKFGWRVVWGNSILPLARNKIISQFMESGYDYLVMLDGDIEVDAKDVMGAVVSGKQFVGIPCSKRSMDVNRLQQFALAVGPEAPAEFLTSYFCAPNFVVDENMKQELDEDALKLNLVKATKVGTGCVILHRSVFEKFQETFPGRSYLEPDGVGEESKTKPPIESFEYFRYSLDDQKFFIGEDFTFCQDWLSTGGDIWLKVDAITRHYGTTYFTFDAAALQPLASKLNPEEKA